MKRFAIVLACLAAFVGGTAAKQQSPMAAANPLTDSTKMYYEGVKGWLTKSAAKMADQDYGFRPATIPASDNQPIRTFGQIIGHVASENFLFCGVASGMQPPAGSDNFEKSKTTKADLQQALADSFAFCDKAWAGTTDVNAKTATDLPFNIGKSTRLGTLAMNTSHDAEHYGNIVTYFRAKGIVPPSSPGGM